MPQIPENGGDTQRYQQGERQGGDPQPFLPVEREGKRRHASCQQDEAKEIKAPGLHFIVRHQRQGGNRADNTDRQVDQEDPVPGGILHQNPAQRRAKQRADLTGQGDEGHRRHILRARNNFHHR